MFFGVRTNNLLIRTLIVDHDPVARKTVIDILSKDPAIRVVEECTNGMEAMASIQEFKPDILICEVESPGIDGLALVQTIPAKRRPVTIFVSNHDHFAARAFEVSAADYIVKPIREGRFLAVS